MGHTPLSTVQVNSFTMGAAKPAPVNIVCDQQLPSGRLFWFTFTQVPTINISDITFVGCKISLSTGDTNKAGSVVFVRSSFVNATSSPGDNGAVLDIRSVVYASSVVVKQCTFSDNSLGRSAIFHSNGYNLAVDQCVFKNNFALIGGNTGISDGGGALSHSNGNLNILNSNFSNNQIANSFSGGAVFTSGWSALIINCRFSGNRASGNAGAVCGLSSGPIIIINSSFSNNTVLSSSSLGGAIYAMNVSITNSTFSDNGAGSTTSHGGAVYLNGGTANVTNSYFINNTAGGRGGAIAVDLTKNIFVRNTTFTKNTAGVGGGGAIYAGGRNSNSYNANISLLNSTFTNNTAAYCGVMDIDKLYRSNAKVVGNTFTYNRATGQDAENNGGGVLCVRNASVTVLASSFSHNLATGYAGVLQVDESDITIEKCTFKNNTAGSNGGVLYSYFYPANYIIIDSLFTNNQAGGDGGVMFVGRAGSQVKVAGVSTFSYNSAKGRGGAIAIAGSTLYINGASLCKKNSAKLGRVISACKSKVVVSPKLPSTTDPDYSFCTLYACSNATYT